MNGFIKLVTSMTVMCKMSIQPAPPSVLGNVRDPFGRPCQLLPGKLGRERDRDTLKVSLPTCAHLCIPQNHDVNVKERLTKKVTKCFPPKGTNAAKALVFELAVLGEVPVHFLLPLLAPCTMHAHTLPACLPLTPLMLLPPPICACRLACMLKHTVRGCSSPSTTKHSIRQRSQSFKLPAWLQQQQGSACV